MNTVPVIFHTRAEQDLDNIEAYHASYAGAPAAAAYVDELVDFCHDIGIFPDAGKSQHFAGFQVRTRTFRKKHQVVYNYDNTRVFIVDIHHTAMSSAEIKRRIQSRL